MALPPRRAAIRAHAVALALPLTWASARAQDCPGLPPVEPPKLETCKGGVFRAVGGAIGLGCQGKNRQLVATYERLTRGFATGLEFDSRYDEEARGETEDPLRGCRGETVNIEITPGTVKRFAYQLYSPSNVIVAQGDYETWTGDRLLGASLTLPESGTYRLVTRTFASAVTTSTTNRKTGRTEYSTYYPRRYRVGFRSDAKVVALRIGDKVDATATHVQPFIRRVFVPGGAKARLRLASLGTGDFSYAVLRESGEDVARGPRTNYVDVPPLSPAADETYRVEARPFTPTGSVGLQLSVLDDRASGTIATASPHVQSAFRLPAQFDVDAHPEHKAVAATETSRLLYQARGAERLGITVRPSGAAALVVRVRVYDQATEDVVLDRRVTRAGALAVTLPRAGEYVIALSPVSAAELAQAGEAKYVLEFALPRGGQAPRAAP